MRVLGTQMVPQVHIAINYPTRAHNLTALPQPVSPTSVVSLQLNILSPTTPSWANFLICPDGAPWPWAADLSGCPTPHADFSQADFGNRLFLH